MSKRGLCIMVLVLACLLVGHLPAQSGTATIRPIADFVEAQGVYCIPSNGDCFLFVPPVKNFLGASDPANKRLASVDYAGLADQYLGGILGTSFSGQVLETLMKDGRAEIRVTLKTQNALTWVADGGDSGDFNGPLLFGFRALDVEDGAEPVLGDCLLKVVFINTAPGAPLPDLIQLLAFPEEGQELRAFSIIAKAKGELRQAFGVPEGTPGLAKVTDVGLFMPPSKSPGWDGFPVERIDLEVVGK
jgi:hypothetical protein